jgi:HSP20 family molecular chaperone IbpA
MDGGNVQKSETREAERTVDRPHFTPRVEIHEIESGLRLRANLPGVPREGLALTVDDGVLRIRGEMRLGLPDAAEALHLEFEEGVWERAFELPEDLDPAKIEARLEDGVLTLDIPKSERALPRRIEVK